MHTIHITVSKPYDVLIENGLLDNVAALIRPYLKSCRIAIVTDDIVSALYLTQLETQLIQNGFEVVSFVFPNGEKSKSISTLTTILEFLAQKGIRRNDMLIALGGGVVGDITGLTAALYMRGVSVIQIPTTLLAAVDSSVGGKTAVNLENGKNLVGAFWQPSLVICDTNIIRNLPEDIFAEGMGEVIKYDIIQDLGIIERIKRNSIKQDLEEVIGACVALKQDIINQDEYDMKGVRNILNVGHTVAHAIEKLSNYEVFHGKAVGTGLVMEAKLSKQLGMCDNELVKEISQAVDQYSLQVVLPWKAVDIVKTMKLDKKNRNEGIVFELPYTLGRCEEIILNSTKAVRLFEQIM